MGRSTSPHQTSGNSRPTFPTASLGGDILRRLSQHSRRTRMRKGQAMIGAAIGAFLFGVRATASFGQSPTVRALNEEALREYAGVYQWGPDAFMYLQLWSEFTGTNQLVAFDE